ncbi:MAG: hypothetical protein KDG51_21615, partial [Calditrichaeota bacterium]|nr:hypothetical protein [Calditrichota bacterium]
MTPQPTPSYQQLTNWENLYRACHNAGIGKRRHPEVAEFEYRLEDQLFTLQEELQSFTYRPGQYYNFYIHEPKRR